MTVKTMGPWNLFRERTRRARAQRAQERQQAYQTEKALRLAASPDDAIVALAEYASSVKRTIETVLPLDPQARVLEVGSGAHGLIFFLGFPNAIGIDPLADLYRSLFPEWQRRAKTIRAFGEALPFDRASFDLVLCDNVIDHAERPGAILAEIARILRPGGTLYFTVHIHHPIYAVASALHATWNALGLRYEIQPFADHTTHFTLPRIRAHIRSLPLRVLVENSGIDDAKEEANKSAARLARDRFKRLFFKNARYEIVAERM
jgi:SAM-dependent methyltransferase